MPRSSYFPSASFREVRNYGWIRIAHLPLARAWRLNKLGMKLRFVEEAGQFYAPLPTALVLQAEVENLCLCYESTRALRRMQRDDNYRAAIEAAFRTGGLPAVGALASGGRS